MLRGGHSLDSLMSLLFVCTGAFPILWRLFCFFVYGVCGDHKNAIVRVLGGAHMGANVTDCLYSLIIFTVTSVGRRWSNAGLYFSRGLGGNFSLDAVLMNTAEVIIRSLQGPGCENKVSHADLGRLLQILPGKELVVTARKAKETKSCLVSQPLKTDIAGCGKDSKFTSEANITREAWRRGLIWPPVNIWLHHVLKAWILFVECCQDNITFELLQSGRG